MKRQALTAVAAIASLVVTLAGCAAVDDATSPAASSDTVRVLASFYPLQYVVEQVGGEHVTVENLTPPGAEPHDLELAPATARSISQADLVLYLSGLQPAVDEGIEARSPQHLIDAIEFTAEHDDEGGTEDDHDADGQDAHADEHAEHEEDHADSHSEDPHNHGMQDPHFWLDPSRVAALGQQVADELALIDPEHADQYAAAALRLGQQMEELDQEFADGLATCQNTEFVTSHEAFGYLADRYSLTQVGISSFDPEAEPSPARIREVRDIVHATDATTIFTETLVSPKVAETLADDLEIKTATLDPLEGLSQEALDSGQDYVSVMRQNLAALKEGLNCS